MSLIGRGGDYPVLSSTPTRPNSPMLGLAADDTTVEGVTIEAGDGARVSWRATDSWDTQAHTELESDYETVYRTRTEVEIHHEGGTE